MVFYFTATGTVYMRPDIFQMRRSAFRRLCVEQNGISQMTQSALSVQSMLVSRRNWYFAFFRNPISRPSISMSF